MPYSCSAYGKLEDLEKINVDNLYEYYKKVLNDNYVDVFVVGDVDSTKIKEIFKEKFKVNTYKRVQNDILVKELKPRQRIVKLKDQDSANQTQLTILCSLNDLTEFERKYVLLVYSEMLGGSSNSLLFDTVREKKIPVVFYLELSNEKIADTICESTGAKKMLFHSCHNITKDDFQAGVTYLDLMQNNVEALKEALEVKQ